MKVWHLLALVTLLITAAPLFACDEQGKTGIVEENSLYIPVGAKSASNVTQEDFNRILDRVYEIYSPIVGELGYKLNIERNWDDGTVNAYAYQDGEFYNIAMFGGLARHETITQDAFALVACHEMGHHLGGAPKKRGWNSSSWASNEGQADYWGTMKCLRKYMEKDNNIEIVSKMFIDPEAAKVCRAQFNNADDIAMCDRGSMAGLSLGNLFKALRSLTIPLKFSTPDQNIVKQTDDNHPAPQCRLDTYFAGATCGASAYSEVSDTDPKLGVCYQGREVVGNRPLCWFKPL